MRQLFVYIKSVGNHEIKTERSPGIVQFFKKNRTAISRTIRGPPESPLHESLPRLEALLRWMIYYF